MDWPSVHGILYTVFLVMQFVACQATMCQQSGASNSGMVMITQDPHPLPQNSKVTLTCNVNVSSAELNDASYFWSMANQRMTCEEKVTSSKNCTFTPTNLSTPIKCEAVYSGMTKTDNANCTIEQQSLILSSNAASPEINNKNPQQDSAAMPTFDGNGQGTTVVFTPFLLYCALTVTAILFLHN